MKSRLFLTLIVFFGLPLIAEAAGAPRTFRDLAVLMVDFLSDATATLFVLALVYFLWNIANNFTRVSTEGMKGFRTFILWGVIALFIMVSIWGILGLLRNTLFQGDQVSGISQIVSATLRV